MIAPAKLNLTLAVGAPFPPADPRAGLHPIATLMVPLRFGDDVELDAADGPVDTLERVLADDAPRPERPIDWSAADDLATHALRALRARVPDLPPTRVRLTKRIPPGSGLAGGSTNAAAVLHLADQIHGLGLTDDDLMQLAGTLGADVVFCLHAIRGGGAMLAVDDGRTLKPAGNVPLPQGLVLVFPRAACPTRAVYNAFDLDGRFGDVDEARALDPAGGCFNDLEPAACTVAPEVGEVLDTLRAAGLDAHLTGSGSTIFVLGADEAAVREATDLPARGVSLRI